MFFSILTLFVALLISGVAAWYSIAGLIAIFAAAPISIAIMGGVLEAGKLLTASWLYQNWKTAPKLLRTYLTVAVIVLMFITSMGIFGFLSKAHIEQTLIGGDNTLKIELLNEQIEIEQRKIDDARNAISQLDAAINKLIEFDRIRGKDGAISVRESQSVERSLHTGTIYESSERIKQLRDERQEFLKEKLTLEAEVGPIKYIAELFVTSSDYIIEDTVRWVIVIIIFVFDPLAVLLVIAANMSIKEHQKKIKKGVRVSKIDGKWENIDFKDIKKGTIEDFIK